MKKLTILFFIVAVACFFTACGDDDKTSSNGGEGEGVVADYSAAGTYTFKESTGEAVVYWETSDFPYCIGPISATEDQILISTLNETTMVWGNDPTDSLTWTRNGVGTGIAGTWNMNSEYADSITLIISENGSVEWYGDGVSCPPLPPNDDGNDGGNNDDGNNTSHCEVNITDGVGTIVLHEDAGDVTINVTMSDDNSTRVLTFPAGTYTLTSITFSFLGGDNSYRIADDDNTIELEQVVGVSEDGPYTLVVDQSFDTILFVEYHHEGILGEIPILDIQIE